MTVGGTNGMAAKKTLSDEDAALWDAVKQTVKPLGQRKVVASAPPPRRPVRAPRPADPLDAPRVPAPAAAIDRRTARRLARGQMAIDRKLDLHGRTQEQALSLLTMAVQQLYAQGGGCLLVVTGRGGRRFRQTGDVPAAYRRREDFAPEGGVLKRQVPLWLTGAELGGFVYAYGPAADSHGGAGALYVMVRRRR
ncbi:hypothetical protein CKO24_00375 [Rhodothalassium salexigens DSM 2132]|nr:hypothetical protein [Rhodothalassium salexigens DSM 2132]